jgi:hypothetical protein
MIFLGTEKETFLGPPMTRTGEETTSSPAHATKVQVYNYVDLLTFLVRV